MRFRQPGKVESSVAVSENKYHCLLKDLEILLASHGFSLYSFRDCTFSDLRKAEKWALKQRNHRNSEVEMSSHEPGEDRGEVKVHLQRP